MTGRPARDVYHEPGRPVRVAAVRAVAAELGLVAAALACYLVVGWYTKGRTGDAIDHARDVLALERLLGVDWEHPVQDATLAVPGLGAFLTQLYFWGYFPALVLMVGWLFVRDRPAYRRLRNALLVSGVAGLLVYAFYPCAPPWIGGSGFTDTVTASSVESFARPGGITNHLGALPSFHVGWVFLVATALVRATRSHTVRALLVVHPMLMAYAVIATGNHWVLDVPAGVLLAVVGQMGARGIAQLSARHRCTR